MLIRNLHLISIFNRIGPDNGKSSVCINIFHTSVDLKQNFSNRNEKMNSTSAKRKTTKVFRFFSSAALKIHTQTFFKHQNSVFFFINFFHLLSSLPLLTLLLCLVLQIMAYMFIVFKVVGTFYSFLFLFCFFLRCFVLVIMHILKQNLKTENEWRYLE